MPYASARLQDNKEVVLAAVRNDGFSFLYASARLKDNKELVLTGVRKYGLSLSCASARLKNNKEVVLAASTNDRRSLKYASKILMSDQEFINQLKLSDVDVFKFCHCSIRKHKDIYLPALKKNPTLCKRFSPNVLLKLEFSSLPKRNKEVILESFEKRTKEKDLFVLAKAKKYILG